jgi:predicted murein hydrolase (TIGR00659 family)
VLIMDAISVLSLLATLTLYFAVKALYCRHPRWWLSPLIVVPSLLVACLLLLDLPYARYFQSTHWLVWLLGPGTVAFAVPIYEQRRVIREHWLSLLGGVLVGMPMAVFSTVGLARWLDLSDLLQRSLAARSVTTPFALLTTSSIGGSTQMVAVFVVLTGVCGMVVGDAMLVLLPLKSKLARGVMLGAAANAAGAVKARELGAQEGVVASLTMVLGGLVTVFSAPLIGWCMA